MSWPSYNLLALFSGLLLVAAGGCQLRPWHVDDMAHFHSAKKAPQVDRTDPDLGLQIAMASHAADSQALSDAMHEVQQLGETNPAAQRKLLAELDQSKPELWPLVVQQFRSSLAYHDQLVATQRKPTQLAATASRTPTETGPQLWPSAPVDNNDNIQASYVPPPDEANPRPHVEQAVLAAPAYPATNAETVETPSLAAPAKELPEVEPVPPPQPTLLTLSHVTFCTNVYGYGAYEPCDARFSPAEQVLLYVEVQDYRCEPTQGGFTTKLGASYQILDERGERVDGGNFPSVEDTCRSQRRDFHIQYGLDLPDTLAPGKYLLRIAMRDLQSGHVGQATIGFEIGGREP